MQRMKIYGVDLVLDVGANTGQFAEEIRRESYSGEFVSFEPLFRPFKTLIESVPAIKNGNVDNPDWVKLRTCSRSNFRSIF